MNKVGRRKFCLLKLISAAQKKRNPLKISFVVDVGGIHIQVLGHVEYMLLKLHLLAPSNTEGCGGTNSSSR